MDKCPTCGSLPDKDLDGVELGRVNGTYKYLGKEYDCDCETQIILRKHYLIAEIPDEYQRLDWETFRAKDVATTVDNYIFNWPNMKSNGLGVELSSVGLGTGKTFTATHIGKELIKLGETVFFCSFRDAINLIIEDVVERKNLEDKLKNSTVLILDEVCPAISSSQWGYFSNRLEDIIRYRTNWNKITIMTTNMTQDELREGYPRTYSLLEAKQWRIELSGEDARMTGMNIENSNLALNGEVRPIT